MRLPLLFFSAALMQAAVASAEPLKLYCGDVEYVLDFQRSTLATTNERIADIEWQYDGDFVRWNKKGDDRFFGVDTRNGTLIVDGTVNERACKIDGLKSLGYLPLSDGANLRKAYLASSSEIRTHIQLLLRHAGFYNSEVDGKWGRGTEKALLEYINENQLLLKDLDPRSLSGAEAIITALSGFTEFYEADCEDCVIDDGSDVETENRGSIEQNSLSEADFFSSYNVACNKLQSKNAADEAWTKLGKDNLIYELSFDYLGTERLTIEGLLELAKESPDFPPLQFFIGYTYWRSADFSNALLWLAKAASQGEPNSSAMLGMIALNKMPSVAGIGLDQPINKGPINIAAATNCLEAGIEFDHPTWVDSTQYRYVYSSDAAMLLVPIYLKSEEFLYGSHQQGVVEWAAVKAEPEMALELLKRYQTGSPSCDNLCLDKLKAEAQRQIEDEAAKVLLEAEENRSHLVYTETEMEELLKSCQDWTTLKSMCWALSEQQLVRVLATKEYICEKKTNMLGENYTDCNQGPRNIYFNDNQIVFSCEALNTCAYEYDEVASMLIDQGLIGELNYRFSSHSDGVNTWHVEEYCGRGPKGEELCVTKEPNLIGLHVTQVVLNRGGAGEDAPSFE